MKKCDNFLKIATHFANARNDKTEYIVIANMGAKRPYVAIFKDYHATKLFVAHNDK